MQFGRLTLNLRLTFGDRTQADSSESVTIRSYSLTRHVHLTLRRYYERPEPITENTRSL
jgi:hypothetical protein